MWFYTMIVILLIALVWLTRVREGFIDMPDIPDMDLSKIPDPQELMKKVRALLDKYDKPEVWNHATQVMDKDPGQLARMNLGISNQ
jgi:hypothetical protein